MSSKVCLSWMGRYTYCVICCLVGSGIELRAMETLVCRASSLLSVALSVSWYAASGDRGTSLLRSSISSIALTVGSTKWRRKRSLVVSPAYPYLRMVLALGIIFF